MIRSKKKSSFFEKLTGAVNADDSFDAFDDEMEVTIDRSDRRGSLMTDDDSDMMFDADGEPAELTVDVHQTNNDVVVQTIVAGTDPDELDVDITRETVTIRGSRHNEHEVEHDGYVHKELYWGSFSRTIILPEEVEVEESKATIKNGLLTITLPKIDKKRKTKLKVEVS